VVGEMRAGIYTRAKVSSSWQDQLGREESGSRRSEWMGKCGGGRYKRRVSGCGRRPSFVEPSRRFTAIFGQTTKNTNMRAGRVLNPEVVQYKSSGTRLAAVTVLLCTY
jgi:hypothetical protein